VGPGGELYRHRYTGIDLEEKVTESALICDLGTATVSWDRMGRVSNSTTPYWQETIPQDGYDKAGNLREACIHDSVGDACYRYSYDNLYQLIHEEGVFADDFSVDSICNRLKKNDTSYQVNSLNQLLSESSAIYNYDKNGNLIEIINGDYHLKFFYDALDRLLAIEQPNTLRLEFFYDSSHRRLLKRKFAWTNGSWQSLKEIRYLFLGNREVGAIDESGAFVEFRVVGRGKGAELGASVGIEMGGAVFCPIHDHRGNITALVDTTTRQVHETYRYSAFGEEQLFDAHGSPQATVCNPWRFASKRFDPETGFVFFGRRYYSPRTGRFLTPDPIGFSDGPNLYAYVHNSPLVLIDPYGLTAFEDVSEATVETGMGMGRAFVHPLDTLYENSGRLMHFGHDMYRGDFSRISNVSGHDAAMFVSARGGEAIGMVAATYGLVKSIPSLVVGGTRLATNAFNRFCAKNACALEAPATTFVERTLLCSKEAMSQGRVTPVSKTQIFPEGRTWAAKVSELETENSARGANQIWTETRKRSPVQNAYHHWEKHGGEFPNLRNAKEYVDEATAFRSRPSVFQKVRPNGERAMYDLNRDVYAVFTQEGTPKTMFKPEKGLKYWLGGR
jgi:RHS repeat-associated protein